MPHGLLEVRGTIDLGQFWPSGRSDADTTTVVLKLAPDAIRFRKSDAAPFRATHVFDDAIVKGRQRKPAIKNGHVTIRLQGIDAPELHFQPTALSKAESTVCPKQKRTPSMSSTTFTDNCSGLRRPKDCMIFWLRPERSLSIPGS